MLKKYFYIAILFTFGVSNAQHKIVPFNNPAIYYEGRIFYSPDAAELSWSGTSAGIMFEGKSISAILKDLDTANYYNVIVDNQFMFKFHTDTLKQSYLLASDLSDGMHNVQLFKRTEWDMGKTLFYGFEIPDSTKLLPPPCPKKTKMEFYGNSITCGYAMEDTSSNDSWYGYFENNYLSYAAITARHFDAQYYCISRSGIGIMVSWFPLIMPEMFDRLNPADSASKWDFSRYTPDVVVIDLFQNDSWLIKMPGHEQFKNRFGSSVPNDSLIVAAYKSFVLSIREKYPEANIICTLGNMDATREGSPWPDYIHQAVEQLNDSKMFAHFFEYKNTDGHPKVAEQKAMAKSLIQFIDRNISW